MYASSLRFDRGWLNEVYFCSTQELAEIMRKDDKIAKQDFIVVDVRDDDYEGGNIKGAVNKPSSEFMAGVDSLVKETKDIPLVIFHCALSQVRCVACPRLVVLVP